ncbi:MAG TPA: ferric reductase-like transmembrane domain-containing protein [Candidatus Saccharimonadales bacterium]|nr:ferric reductase-like transmembrane domain-containing protein [Candidatus Saccharimonadales bacterium]
MTFWSRLHRTLTHYRAGVRSYIALGVLLVTLETWWWASVNYSGTQLFATRLEEVYAWLALGLLIWAVTIGPLYSALPRLPGNSLMRDGRRLFGVGAAWFATLHVSIAYAALFHWANPLDLPRIYQQSFLFGITALMVLLAMAGTSFDRAFHGMGVWWFRLHRFVYLAVGFSLLHAFLIGTHAAERVVVINLALLSALVFGLHVYGVAVRRRRPSAWQMLALTGMAILLVIAFHIGFDQRPIGVTGGSDVAQTR